MSMSQANASLLIDVAAETSRLGVTLTQAEQIVTQSANRMGRQVDSGFGRLGEGLGKKLVGAFGAGMIISTLDTTLRKVSEAIRNNTSIGDAVSNGILESIKRMPVVGALTEIFEPAMERVGETAARRFMFNVAGARNIRVSDRGNEELIAQERQQRKALEDELALLRGTEQQMGRDRFSSAISAFAGSAVQTADTALGTFRFGMGGGAADVSRSIYDKAREQVNVLERIEQIQKEIRDKFGGNN